MQHVVTLTDAETSDLKTLRDSSNEAIQAVGQIRMAIKRAEAQEMNAAQEVISRGQKFEDRLSLLFKAHGIEAEPQRVRWNWDQSKKSLTVIIPDISGEVKEQPKGKRKS